MIPHQPEPGPSRPGIGGYESDLVGYQVIALDGVAGTVEEVGPGYLVVATGSWLLSRRVRLPMGNVTNLDRDNSVLWVDRTRQEVTSSPAHTGGARAQRHRWFR